MHFSSSQARDLPVDEIGIWCPVPLRFHPAGGPALDEQGRSWAIRHRLCEPDSVLAQANIGEVIAAGIPFATTDAAIAMTCYAYWTFAWDDTQDILSDNLGEAVALASEANWVMYEPATAPVPDNRFLSSLRDVRRLLETSLPPEGQDAVRSEHTCWIGGQLWKASLQQRDTAPSLGEYLRMRWQKAGTGVLAAYAAPAAGYTLSSVELYDPVVRAFSQAAFLPCLIINDLVSFFKEQAAGQAHINIVTVLAARHQLSTFDALIKAGELYERLVALMLRLQRQLLSDPRPAVARYASELPYWLSAALHWTSSSLRYLALQRASTTTAVNVPVIAKADQPLLTDASDPAPPSYPELAWLWQYAAG
ncbi:terpene synthase family protein [Streptomyces gilvosporeus]|uniref:Terpene synthase n=1 Tax=Streptomyces gilvosporeus TaxID=553510 RepID=A0A1V0TJQ5_9ACTN|nr:hypothetical protein [Streptomyces gilvosporeus]ARF53164.1 hypothetical protein B1H19_02300 [Streptomyces gilvosporeus]